jgi:hypothetical protein
MFVRKRGDGAHGQAIVRRVADNRVRAWRREVDRLRAGYQGPRCISTTRICSAPCWRRHWLARKLQSPQRTNCGGVCPWRAHPSTGRSTTGRSPSPAPRVSGTRANEWVPAAALSIESALAAARETLGMLLPRPGQAKRPSCADLPTLSACPTPTGRRRLCRAGDDRTGSAPRRSRRGARPRARSSSRRRPSDEV